MIVVEKRQEGRPEWHIYCTRNGCCVGSNIRIGSWSLL